MRTLRMDGFRNSVHILFDMESICQKVRFYITDETKNRLITKIFDQ